VAFRGWPDSALDFYEGLEADNSRAYWLDHKDVYERDVKAPMEALLAELAAEFGEHRIFRPYRATRFSRDKSPYKTTIAAVIGDGYVQLSAHGLMAGAGMYDMANDQLERFRGAVMAEISGHELTAIVEELLVARIEVTAMETLKTAPRGYPKDHPRIELLRHKGLVVMKEWPAGAWLRTAGAKKRVVDLFHAAAPLVAWREGHVGAADNAEAVGRRRSTVSRVIDRDP
jgi:uncharacterized protein (TIGR02453 family)